jgi:predicted permease
LFSYPFYQEVRQRNDVFSEVSALLSMTWNVHGTVSGNSGSGEMEQMDVQLVSGTYFSVLGVRASLGRTLTEADDQTPGGHALTVISYAWWQGHLGGDPAAIGKLITIDQTAYTIIGVAPPEFFGTTVGRAPDLWIPLAMQAQLPPAYWKGRNDPEEQSLYLIARLKNGVSMQQASAAVNLLFKQSLQERAGAQSSPERVQSIGRASIELTPAGKGIAGLRREFSLSLLILMAVVGAVLLIACVNIANLLLTRAANRQKEFAVRVAIGAGRSRLIRQLITESVLLAGLGGTTGVALAWWGSHLLVLMASTGSEALPLDVAPNARILSFTLLVSVLAALLFGLAPALSATRVEPNSVLKSGKGVAQSSTVRSLGKALIVAQVALSLVLLVGAGLFMRTLINLQNMPTGFDQKNVLLFRLDTTTTGYKDAQLSQLTRDVEERVKAVPGVQAASFSFFIFGPGQWTSQIYIREPNPPAEPRRSVRQNVIGADYFSVMRLPLIAGRGFGPQDTDRSQLVAVISESMAQQYFPNTSPLGRRISKTADLSNEMEVIGVVKDAKYGSVMEEVRPTVYYPQSQRPQPLDNFVVRFSGSPEAVISQVRQAIKQVNRSLPLDEVVPLADYVGRTLVQQKLIARLAFFFGLLALVLACVGLYGVLSYAVARRTNEIGVRLALGAQSRDVLWLVFREVLLLVGIGIVTGLVAASAVTRTAESLLYGLQPNDPLTLVLATMTLLAVAALAGYLPARRASKVDPMIALRHE